MSGMMQSHTMNVQLTGKNSLTLDELEFYELSQLAGVNMEPATFKIILDLLKLNVSPQAVLQMLKTMCTGKRKKKLPIPEGENLPPPARTRNPTKVRYPSGSSTTSSSRRIDHKR